jgi:hypothetical protein
MNRVKKVLCAPPEGLQGEVPHLLKLILCVSFAFLYGVWLLPHSVFIRHTSIILGATLSLFVLFKNWRLFFQMPAFPIWLIVGLFLWITLHYLWIGSGDPIQALEYSRVWKKIAISSIFAAGLGLSISINYEDTKKTQQYWRITYIGFLLPAIVYIVKLTATHFFREAGYPAPKYLYLNSDYMRDSFGVARAWYVFFCLPAFAISLGCIAQVIKTKNFNIQSIILYLVTISITLLIFYLENDRLGVILSVLFVLLMSANIVGFWVKHRISSKKVLLILFILLSAFFVLFQSISRNSEWKSFVADAKVAVQIDQYDHWKNRSKGYPLNEIGQLPTDSNYSRIAWAIAGARLLIENPFGYGIMSLSFAGLGKLKWPDSDLSLTHSGWLDFALGYGFPGLLLLGSAVVLAWRNCKQLHFPWRIVGRWGLSSMAIVFLVKEVSFETVVNALIFMVVFVSSMSLIRRGGFAKKN